VIPFCHQETLILAFCCVVAVMPRKRDKEAIPYLERAVKLAPYDPINAWDLGRAYDYADEVKLADEGIKTVESRQCRSRWERLSPLVLKRETPT